MSTEKSDHPTVGMVVIGNEILTGKIQDANSHYLSQELNFLGLELRQINTIPDDFDLIGETVRGFSEQYTWVFTSGGIGPTHDDITITAIASGFGVKAVPHPKLEEAIRTHYADRLTEDHLLMALVPEGAELVEIPGRFFWQVRYQNIFIMPGVPQLFKHRFEALKPMLQGDPLILKEFFLKADEGQIASALRDVAERFPQVLIGSYPDFFKRDYSVKITLESREADTLEAARSELETAFSNLAVPIVRAT